MRRSIQQVLALSALLATTFVSTRAFAQGTTDESAPTVVPQETTADTRHNTEEPKEAEKPAAVLPAVPSVAPAARPKIGDVSITGYFRGSFGASNQQGRMTCFYLALPGGLISKYRLGNECEVWSETHFTIVTYVADNGAVATMHVMPTVFIPTSDIGYPPTGVVNSPAVFTTSTGATLSFPNLYADIKGIPWLFGGTAWAGSRYYKRESIYISDFFYWNPSGVGAGVEDIKIGGELRLSYGAFAVDGEPKSPGTPAPALPPQEDFGIRHDLQLRGIKPFASTEFQVGLQVITNYSNDPATTGGWGVTVQWVQQLPFGDNKLAFQYGRGGGTGFGTLARFYYPDFSVRHASDEYRVRAVEVLTIQPTPWLGSQVGLVYQRDDLKNNAGPTDWYSGGARVAVGFTKHAKLIGEGGYDRVKKHNGSDPQWLAKVTAAAALTADRGFLARPEIRLFYTWATWDATAQAANIDSGMIYRDVYPAFRSGSIFGIQAETWW